MDDQTTGATPEQTAGAPATPDIVASVKAELETQYRNEIERVKRENEELVRVKGNLVTQVSNLKRMTEAGVTQGGYTAPAVIPYAQPSQSVTSNETAERLQRTEMQLQQFRFFDYAAQSGYTDLRDPNVRAVLAQADDEVASQLVRDGYNLADPQTEPLYFKRILEKMDSNPLYTAYKEKRGNTTTAPAATAMKPGEVTASSASGAASEIGAGITPKPEEAAAKRLHDLRAIVYPEDGRRRTGRL
ncbi:MAG: hypothetical protein WC495_05365 [Patescibacteria group bacterium]|jgi:hypothetical protein